MRILFVCNQAENRSRAAVDIYDGKGHEARCAGLYSEAKPLSVDLLQWADLILVFEEAQLDEIKRRHPEVAFEKRIGVIDILDIYAYGSEELRRLIRRKTDEVLHQLSD